MFLALQDALDRIAEIVNVCLGPLGSNGFTWDSIRDFLIQLASTLILFIVIKVFLWKRVTDLLEKKRQAIDSELEEAALAKKRAIDLEFKLQEEYNESKKEVDRLVSEALKEGNLQKEEIIKQAKEEANLRLKNAEIEINEQVKSKEKELRNQIIDVAFLAASKIVEKEINPDKYLDIVDDILTGDK